MTEMATVPEAFYQPQAAPPPAAAPPPVAAQAPASYGTDADLIDIQVPHRDVLRTGFRLLPDPHIYRFTAPKMALMVMPMLEGDTSDYSGAAAVLDWLGQGLSEEDNKKIVARLKDPADDLDVESVNQVAFALIKKVGGNRPPT